MSNPRQYDSHTGIVRRAAGGRTPVDPTIDDATTEMQAPTPRVGGRAWRAPQRDRVNPSSIPSNPSQAHSSRFQGYYDPQNPSEGGMDYAKGGRTKGRK